MLATPKRVVVGADFNRLILLLAILHKHSGLQLASQDVFINVAGGVKIAETGCDVALLCAILSSFRNKALPADLIVFGELGLSGEIRPVPSGQERLQEAYKHGFKRAIVPSANAPKKEMIGFEVISVQTLADVLRVFDEL
jgi:DNA repair protein RadA/Sms